MTMRDTVYLHLRKDAIYWRKTFKVVKMAKSIDAEVTPGDVVVKAVVTLPDDFFNEAIPTVEIALDADRAVRFAVDQEDLDPDMMRRRDPDDIVGYPGEAGWIDPEDEA